MKEIIFKKNAPSSYPEPDAPSYEEWKAKMEEYRNIFENEENGLKKIIAENPDCEILEISGYSDIQVPENIGTLLNLQCLVIEGAKNIPETITNCQQLHLVAFTRTEEPLDIGVLDKIEKFEVVNICNSPNVKGYEKFDPEKRLVVKQ